MYLNNNLSDKVSTTYTNADVIYILIKISKLPLYNIEYFHDMLTEFPDILHSVIHIDYKCFTRQKIAKLPKITELERVLYTLKNPCLWNKTAKLIYFEYVFAIKAYYQTLKKQETSTKYRAHVHQRAVERHYCFADFYRKCNKQPEITIWVTP